MTTLNITEEDILKMPISELWDTAVIVVPEEHLEEIKNGIKMKIPIWYITEGWYELHPNSKTVKVQGYPKNSLIEFMEEIDERKARMRELIIDNLTDEDPTKPRTR